MLNKINNYLVISYSVLEYWKIVFGVYILKILLKKIATQIEGNIAQF